MKSLWTARPLHTFPDGRTTHSRVVRGPQGVVGANFNPQTARLLVAILNQEIAELGDHFVIIPATGVSDAEEIQHSLSLDSSRSGVLKGIKPVIVNLEQ